MTDLYGLIWDDTTIPLTDRDEAIIRRDRGIKFYNATRPGWANLIDWTDLDINSTCGCIIGQLADNRDSDWSDKILDVIGEVSWNAPFDVANRIGCDSMSTSYRTGPAERTEFCPSDKLMTEVWQEWAQDEGYSTV